MESAIYSPAVFLYTIRLYSPKDHVPNRTERWGDLPGQLLTLLQRDPHSPYRPPDAAPQ